MPSREKLTGYLAARIERWMESGEPVLTLEYMLPAVERQFDLLRECLTLWQSEGRIEWLKPLDPMKPTEEVVRFRTYITRACL